MIMPGTAVHQRIRCGAITFRATEKHYSSYDVDQFAHLCNLTSKATHEH